MTQPVIFISIPYSLIKNEAFTFMEKGIGVNMLVDSASIDMAIVINFVRHINYEFIYTLSENALNDPEFHRTFPALYLLFCLSGSFRRYGNTIPIFSNDEGSHTSTIDQLRQYFYLQGERSIEFAIFVASGVTSINKNILLLSESALVTLNETEFEELNKQMPTMTIVSTTSVAIPQETASRISLLQQDRLAKQFFAMCAFRTEANWHQRQSNLWKSRADLYYSFISLSKKVGETQYYDILNWYEKEYEVLPLWYKRFGHIIKVLLGKRTLKSLRDRSKRG